MLACLLYHMCPYVLPTKVFFFDVIQNSECGLPLLLTYIYEFIYALPQELRAAANELGRVTGAIGVEEVLGAIFAEFCIGK